MAGNFDTIRAVTDNIKGLLQAEGIHFSRALFDDERTIPASLIPFGTLTYAGESFEYPHAQRPGYAEAEFRVKVVVGAHVPRDTDEVVASLQRWTHKLRSSLIVDNLNTGDLSASKLVSEVRIPRTETDSGGASPALLCTVTVRYREV